MPCSLLGHGRRGRGSGLRGPTSSRRVLTPWGQLDLRCFTPQSSSVGLACRCTHVCRGPFSPFPIPGAPQPTVCYFWGGGGSSAGWASRTELQDWGLECCSFPGGLLCSGPPASWEAGSIRGLPPLVGCPPWHDVRAHLGAGCEDDTR